MIGPVASSGRIAGRFSFGMGVVLFLTLCCSSVQSAVIVTASNAAIATPSPVATLAGLDVLRRGGSAADAGVAAVFALAVARPDLSPLGGGGMLLYFDNTDGAVWCLDFREVAPRGETSAPETTGAGSIAVPGGVAGLTVLHQKFGSTSWSALLDPAIRLAATGEPVSASLRSAIAESRDRLAAENGARLLLPGGELPPIDATIAQPQLAATLRVLARKGGHDFYDGSISRRLVRDLRKRGSTISHTDLRRYEPHWRAPVRIDAGEHSIYTAPPPSVAGVVLAGALASMKIRELAAMPAPLRAHLTAEALHRGSIPRGRVADPDRVRLPLSELLAPSTLEALAASIDATRATPPNTLSPAEAEREPEGGGHISIIDDRGNALSMSFSPGKSFGSAIVVEGIFMNAAMEQFTSAAEGGRAPNAAEPGKRPRSSMAPAIVLDDGAVRLVAGSAAGPSAPSVVLQLYIAMLAGERLGTSVDAVRIHHQAAPDEVVIELAGDASGLTAALTAYGHPLRRTTSLGSVHAIAIEDETLVAVADGRDGGSAGGY